MDQDNQNISQQQSAFVKGQEGSGSYSIPASIPNHPLSYARSANTADLLSRRSKRARMRPSGEVQEEYVSEAEREASNHNLEKLVHILASKLEERNRREQNEDEDDVGNNEKDVQCATSAGTNGIASLASGTTKISTQTSTFSNDRRQLQPATQQQQSYLFANNRLPHRPISPGPPRDHYEGQSSFPEPPKGYAKLQGQNWSYYLTTLAVVLGKSPDVGHTATPEVDVYLGHSSGISKKHLRIEYNRIRRIWELYCFGRAGVFINERHYESFCQPVHLESRYVREIMQIYLSVRWFELKMSNFTFSYPSMRVPLQCRTITISNMAPWRIPISSSSNNNKIAINQLLGECH